MKCELPLTLGDLTLRRIEPDDAADLHAIYSRPEVAQYELWDPWSWEMIERHVQTQLQIRIGDPGVPLALGVELETDRRLIGECQINIHSSDERQAELGFAFNPDFAG